MPVILSIGAYIDLLVDFFLIKQNYITSQTVANNIEILAIYTILFPIVIAGALHELYIEFKHIKSISIVYQLLCID